VPRMPAKAGAGPKQKTNSKPAKVKLKGPAHPPAPQNKI